MSISSLKFLNGTKHFVVLHFENNSNNTWFIYFLLTRDLEVQHLEELRLNGNNLSRVPVVTHLLFSKDTGRIFNVPKRLVQADGFSRLWMGNTRVTFITGSRFERRLDSPNVSVHISRLSWYCIQLLQLLIGIARGTHFGSLGAHFYLHCPLMIRQ